MRARERVARVTGARIAAQHQAVNGYEPKWFQAFQRSIASLRSNRLEMKRIRRCSECKAATYRQPTNRSSGERRG
jgi:hypothetical protein